LFFKKIEFMTLCHLPEAVPPVRWRGLYVQKTSLLQK